MKALSATWRDFMCERHITIVSSSNSSALEYEAYSSSESFGLVPIDVGAHHAPREGTTHAQPIVLETQRTLDRMLQIVLLNNNVFSKQRIHAKTSNCHIIDNDGPTWAG